MYLHIKNIHVQNANALTGFYTYGNASLPTYAGFIHALELEINASLSTQDIFGNALKIKFSKFIPVLKNHDFKYGHQRYMPYKKSHSALAKNVGNVSTKDEKYYHGCFSLILKLEGDTVIISDKARAESIKNLILYLNFAGGSITNVDSVTVVGTLDDLYDDGMVYTFSEVPSIETASDLASTLENLIPIVVGYAGLSRSSSNKNSRNGNKHLFVEPVLGFARPRIYSSVRKENGLDKLFFSSVTNSDSETYLIKQLLTGDVNEQN